MGMDRPWAEQCGQSVLIIVLFYGVVTPVGLTMRAFGKDPLRLRRDANAASYWIDCREGSEASDMRRQF